MESRRWQADGHNEPQMQVVGFHVEGQSPSPSPTSILQDSLRTISSGSPVPVIIPPQFQRESSITRTGESAATRSLAPEFAAGQNVLRTTSQIDKTQGTVQLSVPPPAAEAPADTAADASSSSASTGTSGTPAAAAVSSQQQAAATSSDNGSQTEQAASSAAADKPSRESKKAPPADSDKPPPKVPKPTSKAERRALQEAQRAAKAAAKGGPPPAGSKGATGAASGSSADVSTVPASSGRPPKAPTSQQQGSAGQGTPVLQGSGRSQSAGAGYASDTGSAAGVGVAGSRAAAGAAAAGHKSRVVMNSLSSTELFAHLQQYRPVSIEGVLRTKEGSSVHPAVLALGLKYADGTIKGSTARCVAMVNALCQVIADYHTPPGKSLTRDLMGTINASVDFLVRCRPLSVSMGNAIKALKLYLSKIDPAAPEDEAKQHLVTLMAEWLNEKVAVADKVLVEHAVSKVYNGDVILTYAYSQVVLEVFLSAARQGKRFTVMVVDSRPELEGRQLMRRLLQADIPCSYVLLSGLSYTMREVSKVMLGAAAVLSNGTVLGRAGSAVVAMCAAASSKPVLVCCEAFKFHERVQLDSITHNELGDPDALAHLPAFAPAAAVAPGAAVDPEKGVVSQGLSSWRDIPRLALLNLKYDAMPAEYVTMVVTEFGMIPPSSVPVILREFSESAQME